MVYPLLGADVATLATAYHGVYFPRGLARALGCWIDKRGYPGPAPAGATP